MTDPGQPPGGPRGQQPPLGGPWGQQPPPGGPWGQQPAPSPWAQQAPAVAGEEPPPHPEPRTHPRLLRTVRWTWWRSPLGLMLALGVLGAAILVYGAVLAGADALDPNLDPGDFSDPLGLLLGNLLIAAAIPASVLAVLAVHRERPGWLFSVTSRLRWHLLWRFSLLALGAVVVLFVASFAVGLALGPLEEAEEIQVPGLGALLPLVLVILLSTPLQAAGEEVLFRGYLTQALAGYGRSGTLMPLVAVAVSATLFALAHGNQDAALFLDRLLFALVCSWLAWRTGGLEAAIALHVVYNLLALLFSAATGALDDALTAETLPWPFLAVDAVVYVVYALAAARWADSRGEARRSPARPAAPPGQGGVLAGPPGIG